MYTRSIAINSEGQMLVGGSGQWYQPSSGSSGSGASGDGVTRIKAGKSIYYNVYLQTVYFRTRTLIYYTNMYTPSLCNMCSIFLYYIYVYIGNTVGFLIYIPEEEPHGHDDEEGHNSDPLQAFHKIDSNNTLSTINSNTANYNKNNNTANNNNNNNNNSNKFPPATSTNITNETKKGHNYDSSDTLNYSSVVDDHNVNDNSTNKEEFSLQINIGMCALVIMYCALSIASILT